MTENLQEKCASNRSHVVSENEMKMYLECVEEGHSSMSRAVDVVGVKV